MKEKEVRHELRNKLMIIDGCIELLSKTDLTEEQQKYLEPIKRNIRQCVKIIKDWKREEG